MPRIKQNLDSVNVMFSDEDTKFIQRIKNFFELEGIKASTVNLLIAEPDDREGHYHLKQGK